MPPITATFVNHFVVDPAYVTIALTTVLAEAILASIWSQIVATANSLGTTPSHWNIALLPTSDSITVLVREQTIMTVGSSGFALIDAQANHNRFAIMAYESLIRGASCLGLLGACSATVVGIAPSNRGRRLQSDLDVNVSLIRQYDFTRSANATAALASLLRASGIVVRSLEAMELSATSTVTALTHLAGDSPLAAALAHDSLGVALAIRLRHVRADVTSHVRVSQAPATPPPPMPAAPVPPRFPLSPSRPLRQLGNESSQFEAILVVLAMTSTSLLVVLCCILSRLGIAFYRSYQRVQTALNHSSGAASAQSCARALGQVSPRNERPDELPFPSTAWAQANGGQKRHHALPLAAGAAPQVLPNRKPVTTLLP